MRLSILWYVSILMIGMLAIFGHRNVMHRQSQSIYGILLCCISCREKKRKLLSLYMNGQQQSWYTHKNATRSMWPSPLSISPCPLFGCLCRCYEVVTVFVAPNSFSLIVMVLSQRPRPSSSSSAIVIIIIYIIWLLFCKFRSLFSALITNRTITSTTRTRTVKIHSDKTTKN